jgi:hypothetical protein
MEDVIWVFSIHAWNIPYRMNELLQALKHSSVFLLLLKDICNFSDQIILGYSFEVSKRIIDRHEGLID